MQKMVFEITAGEVIPRLPREADGRERVGLLSLEEAAARSGRPAAVLAQIWRSTFDFLPADASIKAVGEGKPRVDPEVGLDVLRHVKFAHLSNEDYELVISTCQARGLNPWCQHVYADLVPDEHGIEHVELMVTVAGLRVLAELTNNYAGQTAPEWCGEDGRWVDVWLGDQPPAAARIGIRRKDCPEPTWGVALWKDFAQYSIDGHGQKRYGEFWERMGAHMISKCAEALGLKKAHPELSGLYTVEEMMQARNPRRRREPLLLGVAMEGYGGNSEGEVTEDTPHTRRQFELALVDMGLGNKARRDAAIRRLEGELGSEGRPFYAAALARVKADPERYGAELVTAE